MQEEQEPREDEEEGPAKLAKAVERTNREPRLLRAARIMRQMLPGDSDLGDPLSTAGERPSDVLARRMMESAEQPSVARELGLGAVQIWQALSEAQGRGKGEVEVSILFTDLVDFSSWALEAGDETTLELLRKVDRVSADAVSEHLGKVVKRLGDGLMAVFTDPAEAVRAAHESCREVGAIDLDGYRPALRAGVHVGRPRKMGGDYLGVDVNVAARVADAAEGGQVLVTHTVSERLDEDAYRLKRLRRFKAKGAPKDLEVYSAEPA
jgi:adenylate cyclase